MCGRFSFTIKSDELMDRFGLDQISFELVPRYNVAPGQMIAAIIEDQGQRRIGQLRWGLIPSWASDEKIGYKLINARAETLQDRPSFRNLFQRKRCIIPADGFYEFMWKQGERGKQPMRITLKTGEPFAFAGLFDTWKHPDGHKVSTCTIITTQPNKLVADIHNRMPAILRQDDESLWLDREKYDADLLKSLLVPYEADLMRAYPVSQIVGNAKNDLPQCIEEVPW